MKSTKAGTAPVRRGATQILLSYRIVLHRLVFPLRALHLEHMNIAINIGHCLTCKFIVSLETGVECERMRPT
jgi:hypothetical protein